MGESRTELLAWINDLLQLTYTKVEQAGTGAAYCQVMDSIFNDVHMSKVKFDTKHEYEYVTNYKVLQHSFDKHKIDKIIPVDKLMKCKFQDNLEFMQWVKRYWEQNFPGGEYDAVGRRKGGVGPVKTPARSTAAATTTTTTAARKPASSTQARGAATNKNVSRATYKASVDHAALNDMGQQITELKVTVDGLEKERDFYFGKLREIEILVQEQLQAEDNECLQIIQGILYRTEEGFEVPPEEDEEAYDDETF